MAKKKVFSIGTALSQGLEETIESAQNYSSELRVDIIPIRKIEFDPSNPRNLALTSEDIQYGINNADDNQSTKIKELEALQGMADSIKAQGIINPILVYKCGENYRLIAGERRTLASILAGKTDIQAKILDEKPDTLKISLLQWIENIERSDLTLWERLSNLKAIVNAYSASRHISSSDITVTELSELLNCVKSHALNYKAVLNADNELNQLIADNKIKNLEKAALVADIKQTTIRRQAIEACLLGATLKQLKSIAYLDNHKPILADNVKRRGRRSISINFGATKKLQVAKVVIESILSNKALTHFTLGINPSNIDWNDYHAVTETFKQLLKSLEKSHS